MLQCLARCREEVCEALHLKQEDVELSMGMSGDFEEAVIPFRFSLWCSCSSYSYHVLYTHACPPPLAIATQYPGCIWGLLTSWQCPQCLSCMLVGHLKLLIPALRATAACPIP